MSKSICADVGAIITDQDVVEYERRLNRLRELMQEHGFDAFIARSSAMGMMGFEDPAYFLTNFSLGTTPGIVVVPLAGEPALILKPGFNHSFVREAQRQSWIRNIVPLDIGTDVAALEQNTAAPESAASMAKVLQEANITKGRAAVIGGDFPGLDELKGLLPNVSFEATPLLPWVATLGGAYGGPGANIPNIWAPLFKDLSEWQIKRLEETTDAGQHAMQAYVAAARNGATIREAAQQARSAAIAAGADQTLLHGTISSEPWGYWNLDTAAPEERFHPGHMYFIQIAGVSTRGYSVQIARSFTIEEPTPAQRHLMDMMRLTLEAVVNEAKIGRTGQEIWAAVNKNIENEGIEVWSQYGHNLGAHGGGMIAFSNIQGDWVEGTVEEGHLLVVHPTLCNLATGDYGMTGDCFVIHNGKARNLARHPLPHDFI